MTPEMQCQLALARIEAYYRRGFNSFSEELRLLNEVWRLCPCEERNKGRKQ